MNITASATDIRCKAGVAACGSANAADGADYTGELEGTAQIRISDHFNAVAPGGGTDPATVIDIPFPVITRPARRLPATAIGSTCAITTTANAVVPGAVKDTKRAIVEIGQLQVFDGGPDGVAATDAQHAVRGPGNLHSLAHRISGLSNQATAKAGSGAPLPAFRYFGHHARGLIRC